VQQCFQNNTEVMHASDVVSGAFAITLISNMAALKADR
jgi:hypothetical protein